MSWSSLQSSVKPRGAAYSDDNYLWVHHYEWPPFTVSNRFHIVVWSCYYKNSYYSRFKTRSDFLLFRGKWTLCIASLSFLAISVNCSIDSMIYIREEISPLLGAIVYVPLCPVGFVGICLKGHSSDLGLQIPCPDLQARSWTLKNTEFYFPIIFH